jgi:hypothetical protein
MFETFKVVHFCKGSEHNVAAQNKHNDMCQRRDTWSVIMESDDFKNGNGVPKDFDKFDTDFKIVKPTGTRFVVVMDISGSMKEFVSGQTLQTFTNIYSC